MLISFTMTSWIRRPKRSYQHGHSPRVAGSRSSIIVMALVLLLVMPSSNNPYVVEAGVQQGTIKTKKEQIIHSFPNGVPGSGYGCDNTCGFEDPEMDVENGDVYYTIRASLETYELKGSKENPPPSFGSDTLNPSLPVSMFTRTFTGVKEQSSPFCSNDGVPDDGTTGALGPCMQVFPGQKVKVRLINDMKDGMTQLMQSKASLERYWQLVNETGQPNLDNIDWFGPDIPSPDDMFITNEVDLPGWDATYDDVNLHFHGMQIVPHLFYPEGTANPNANWITAKPINEENGKEQQCFCWVFEIPPDHPQGQFFWHVHRHGSVTMQEWQGMVGLLNVGDATTAGSPENDLIKNDVVAREEDLVLWEWVIATSKRIGPSKTTNTFFEGNFIPLDDGGPGSTTVTTFMANNEYQPSFNDVCVNEILHFRLLCAQTTTGSALYVFDENDVAIDFYVFASDGISYDHPVKKNVLAIGPGQRQGLLMRFEKSGQYRIMQAIINDFQGDGEDLEATPTAYINVIDATNDSPCSEFASSDVNILELMFTPGMGGSSNDISTAEVSNQVSVNFEVQSQKDRFPVPQFIIDGEEFNTTKIVQTQNATAGSSWTLTSNMNYLHPFHIHVNPFQVSSMTTGKLPGILFGNVTFKDAIFSTNLDPSNMWRDTVMIAPFGMTVINQRFGESIAWTGKTVFHCHFLDHEDQGMIAAMIIADPRGEEPPTQPTKKSAKKSKGKKMKNSKQSK